MNLRHFTIFKTVCDEGSITGAARKLSMTQPAVSHAINELEETLGISLFDRVSRKIVMNGNGRIYLSKVIPMLELYHELETQAGLSGQAALRIGSSPTLAGFLLPEALSRFQQDHTGHIGRVLVGNSIDIENHLLNNEIDVGLIEGVVREEQLEKIPFSSYPLAIICPPEHPFSQPGRPPVALNRLAEESLILLERGSAIRDTFDSALTLNNLSVTPIWSATSSDVIVRAVKKQLGIGVVPRIFADEFIKRGEIVEIDVAGLEISCMNHVVFRKDKFQSESFQNFINLILFN